jgi:hypothetical protein
MPQPKITLYVDIVSPFAYIAYYILKVCSCYPLKEEERNREGKKEKEDGKCVFVCLRERRKLTVGHEV